MSEVWKPDIATSVEGGIMYICFYIISLFIVLVYVSNTRRNMCLSSASIGLCFKRSRDVIEGNAGSLYHREGGLVYEQRLRQNPADRGEDFASSKTDCH